MNNTNRAFNTIYTNIQGDIYNPRIACYVKGQMNMALQCGAIDKEQYGELENIILNRYGFDVICSAQIMDSDNIYWDCYIVRDSESGIYQIAIDIDDIEEIAFSDGACGVIYYGDIYAVFCKEDIADYEVYDSNGQRVDFGELNGITE